MGSGGLTYTLQRKQEYSEQAIHPMLAAKDIVLNKLKVRPSMGAPSHRFAGELIG